MKSIFDFRYRPGMDDKEWGRLVRDQRQQDENEEYTSIYLQNQRKEREREQRSMVETATKRQAELAQYNARKAETDRIRDAGKADWAAKMKQKWGW